MAITTSSAASNLNAQRSLSAYGRQRLRSREQVRGYYNDMGGSRGNCTFGIGILLHRGPCTAEEMNLPLSATQIEASFNAAVRQAEAAVRRNVTHQELTQQQFDALVSYSYNTGANGAADTFRLVDVGRLEAAANKISRNTHARINGRRVHIRGLVDRRREESAPFRGVQQERK